MELLGSGVGVPVPSTPPPFPQAPMLPIGPARRMTIASRRRDIASVSRPRRTPQSVARSRTNPTGHGNHPAMPARRNWAALATPVASATWIFDGIVNEALPGVTVQVEFGGRLAQLIVALPAEPFTGVSSKE